MPLGTVALVRFSSFIIGLCFFSCSHGAGTRPPPESASGDPVAAIESRLRGELDAVLALDNHTHLLQRGPGFHPAADSSVPLALRSETPDFWRAVTARFGIEDTGDHTAVNEKASAAREAEIKKDAAAYWKRHLEVAKLEFALVNQREPVAKEFAGLRWVAEGSALLYPGNTDGFGERDPLAKAFAAEQARTLQQQLKDGAQGKKPETLAGYLAFMRDTLKRWKADGAVAIKISDAYARSLAFGDTAIAETEAARLYGKTAPNREEILRLQNFLARHMFVVAGELGIAVHFHTGLGRPPFMRLGDASVLRLDSLLTDSSLFKTRFVLLHAGNPEVDEAAYLAIKPHVWVDISAIAMLVPARELRAALRTLVINAPNSLLFGTDAIPSPTVPVGVDIHHIATARKLRAALYRVLAELVHEGVTSYPAAVAIGRDVLRENARRLYGF